MRNFLIVLPILVAFQAQASMPQKYLRCSERLMVPKVEGSAGLFFNDDCSTAYVLPPSIARISFSDYQKTLNAELCPMIRDDLKDIEKLNVQMKGLLSSNTEVDLPSDPFFPASSKESLQTILSEEDQATYERLMRLRDAKLNSLDRYKNLQGASVTAEFVPGAQEIIEKYQRLLPNVQFVPMPLDWAVLSFTSNAIGVDSMPVVLAAQIPGIKSLPTGGEFKIEDQQTVIFGSGMTGLVTVSVLGACAMDSTNLLKSGLVANMTYGYSLAVKAKYTAKYNLGAFVRKVRESERRGGFFSSHTVTSVTEERNSSEWFEFAGEFEDASFKKAELEQEVKLQMIDRVFKVAAALGFGTQTPAIPLPTPTAHGAQVAATALDKCPNQYCQLLSAGLRFSDAVFGSDTAADSFASKNDFWSVESVSSSVAFKYLGTTGFR